jgi:hypothetical protein
MSMPKHTPGPWYVCGGYSPGYIAINSADGYIIYGMADYAYTTEHGKLIKAPDYESQRANAKLIASAPEMAAELELLRKQNEHLLELLKPLANLDINHLSDRGADYPIFAINDTMIELGDVRDAKAAIEIADKMKKEKQ